MASISRSATVLPAIPIIKCNHNCYESGILSCYHCWICRGKTTKLSKDCDHEEIEIRKIVTGEDGQVTEYAHCFDCAENFMRKVPSWSLVPQTRQEVKNESDYYYKLQLEYDEKWLIRHTQGKTASKKFEKELKDANKKNNKRKSQVSTEEEPKEDGNDKKQKMNSNEEKELNNNEEKDIAVLNKKSDIVVLNPVRIGNYIIHTEKEKNDNSYDNYTICGNPNCQDTCDKCMYAPLDLALQLAKDRGITKVFGMPISLIEQVP
jgi:hypothetical protein